MKDSQWIKVKFDEYGDMILSCPYCHEKTIYESFYCPNCGRRMKFDTHKYKLKSEVKHEQ